MDYMFCPICSFTLADVKAVGEPTQNYCDRCNLSFSIDALPSQAPFEPSPAELEYLKIEMGGKTP